MEATPSDVSSDATRAAKPRSEIMRFFAFSHLASPALRDVSQSIAEVANRMDATLPDGPEKQAGLRKLLEAKECFVRAALPVLVLALIVLAARGAIAAPEGPGGNASQPRGRVESRVVQASESVTLLVTDAGYFWLGVDDSGRPQVYEFTRVVILTAPKTDPVPSPPGTTPPGGLAAKSRQWLATVPEGALKATVRKALATALSLVADSHTKCRTVTEFETLLSALAEGSVPGSEKGAWKPYFDCLWVEIRSLKNAGKVMTPADLAAVLNEIAAGLE